MERSTRHQTNILTDTSHPPQRSWRRVSNNYIRITFLKLRKRAIQLCNVGACVNTGIYVLIYFSPFSPFAAVSMFGVAGLAETFPSFSVSGPFLLDVPGFQVPSYSIVPPQLWSSSGAPPLHLHFCNCSDVFSFTSSFDVLKPF